MSTGAHNTSQHWRRRAPTLGQHWRSRGHASKGDGLVCEGVCPPSVLALTWWCYPAVAVQSLQPQLGQKPATDSTADKGVAHAPKLLRGRRGYPMVAEPQQSLAPPWAQPAACCDSCTVCLPEGCLQNTVVQRRDKRYYPRKRRSQPPRYYPRQRHSPVLGYPPCRSHSPLLRYYPRLRCSRVLKHSDSPRMLSVVRWCGIETSQSAPDQAS